MESKVCKVINTKRIHSDDDDDNINSKHTKRHTSQDRQSTKDKSDKGGSRNYEELKVGDPYYSGGTASDNRKSGDRYKDESRHRRRHRSRDRDEKENRSRNADSKKEEQIGAPYYSGGIAGIDERESGEETSSDEDDKIGQRYYSTETADTQRKNSENYWNKYAKKDKRPNGDVSDVPLHQKKTVDLLTSKTGGAYIPPAKLRMMQESITDKSSAAYQRIAWEALKKSIHGLTNKINVDNIGKVTRDLLRENIVRGRGLLCRSIMQAQLASTTYTHVYAALVAIINTKFPNIGELLLTRCIVQFKRAYRRSEKSQCLGSVTFIAHLINQSVAHEILALELLTLFVETPTEDSIEVAVAFLKECGQKMSQVSKKGMNAIFDMLRNILHDGQLDKRVQYMIEVMFQIRKDGFKDHPAVIEQLDLVPEEDQFTHLLTLDSAKDTQDILNVFKFDTDFESNEERYKSLRAEILGSDNEDDSASENEGDDDDDDDDDDDEEDNGEEKEGEGKVIIDNTETNMISLRKTIYLTIHSSLDYEECAHKLMKMQLKPGQEIEMCHMFLDCCGEQRTYEKFFGLLAQRFCQINNVFIEPLEKIFIDSYATVHRLETNKLRNVARFFAHLLFTDSISWAVLSTIHLNEDETTSSSRIYIKILFQELAEHMGLNKLNARVQNPELKLAFEGIFPKDNPKNTRFSINFFTSIGLGGLTDELRDFLKVQPKQVPAIAKIIDQLSESSDSDSDSSSSSSSSSSDSSSSSSSSSGSSNSSSSSSSSSSNSSSNKRNKRRKDHDKSKQNVERKENEKPKINEKRNEIDKPRRHEERKDNDMPRQKEDRNENDSWRRNEDKRDNDKSRKYEERNDKTRRYEERKENNDKPKRYEERRDNDMTRRNEERRDNDMARRNEERRDNDMARRNEERNLNDRSRRNEDRNENDISRKNEERKENYRPRKNDERKENDRPRRNEERKENDRHSRYEIDKSKRNENEKSRRNVERRENDRSTRRNEEGKENDRKR